MDALRNDPGETVSALHGAADPGLPVADKLAEWQRRLALLRLTALQAELCGGSRARLVEQAMSLGHEIYRDRKIFVALVAALERESRVDEVQAGCDRVTAGVRQLLRQAGYCDR